MHVNALDQLDMKTRKLMLQASDTEAILSIRPAQEGLQLFCETGEFWPLLSESVAYQRHRESHYLRPAERC